MTSGPWEDFQQQGAPAAPAAGDGPWADFQQQGAPAAVAATTTQEQSPDLLTRGLQDYRAEGRGAVKAGLGVASFPNFAVNAVRHAMGYPKSSDVAFGNYDQLSDAYNKYIAPQSPLLPDVSDATASKTPEAPYLEKASEFANSAALAPGKTLLTKALAAGAGYLGSKTGQTAFQGTPYEDLAGIVGGAAAGGAVSGGARLLSRPDNSPPLNFNSPSLAAKPLSDVGQADAQLLARAQRSSGGTVAGANREYGKLLDNEDFMSRRTPEEATSISKLANAQEGDSISWKGLGAAGLINWMTGLPAGEFAVGAANKGLRAAQRKGLMNEAEGVRQSQIRNDPGPAPPVQGPPDMRPEDPYAAMRGPAEAFNNQRDYDNLRANAAHENEQWSATHPPQGPPMAPPGYAPPGPAPMPNAVQQTANTATQLANAPQPPVIPGSPAAQLLQGKSLGQVLPQAAPPPAAPAAPAPLPGYLDPAALKQLTQGLVTQRNLLKSGVGSTPPPKITKATVSAPPQAAPVNLGNRTPPPPLPAWYRGLVMTDARLRKLMSPDK